MKRESGGPRPHDEAVSARRTGAPALPAGRPGDAAEFRFEQRIEKALDGVIEPTAKIARLLDLSAELSESWALERLGRRILAVLHDPPRPTLFFDESGALVDRLRQLRALQEAVTECPLPEPVRREIGDRLDAFAVLNLDRQRLFKKLADRRGARPEKALAIVRLWRAGAFTRGAAEAAARREIGRYVRHGRFADDARSCWAAGDSTSAWRELSGGLEELGIRLDRRR
ncbi:hypothetical protein [Oceanibacterium hippocampi]|uniref:Uncharacterized protein n=1 Tax=Oceanibacterium hippocampi TaxID=745714 RepID=A0A1Y5T3R5_9PROT|nr:hypothetical protein [Oceanibacterium hippocampi]SLN55042.1 hypothetical protein OCH7691_02357 [Oceanibacterium hippocampi]